jgi:REP element-mobilizing transposase RayT
LIWGTLNRDRVLNKKAAAALSQYLIEYADEQALYMKINFVNPDHVHALIDLPTGFSVEKTVQLLKGGSSHWVNSTELVTGKFAWAEAMERSRYRIPTWTWWRGTSPNRKNIIGNGRLQTNCESSSIVTAFIGTTKEAVETAYEVNSA